MNENLHTPDSFIPTNFKSKRNLSSIYFCQGMYVRELPEQTSKVRELIINLK
jgi:hypothetical protein